MSEILNRLLSELADQIDITDSQEGAIRRAYNSVADWLNQNDTAIAKHDVCIFPQGSMMYGTAIKPINEDDYDIDLVCKFTKFARGLSPEYVKQGVGNRIKQHDKYKKMLEPEGRRCWTLQYSENLNFHMDILPAIPFEEDYRADARLNEAFRSIKYRQDLALLATDKNKETGRYRFIATNPRGYAEWFWERTRKGQTRRIFDSIERVPDYPTKTILQKAIQLLKRHRDVYFTDKEEDLKPISMIITTLAAKCYNGEKSIYDFIIHALDNMKTFIESSRECKYIIRNPVMANENFADKWNEKPEKAMAFFDWLKQSRIDFKKLQDVNTYTEYDKILKELFSQKPVDRLMEKYKANIQKEKDDEQSVAIDYKPKALIDLEHLTYRLTPPWVLPKGFRVMIQAKVSYDGGFSFSSFTSGQILPKGVDLQFFPVHSIPQPYNVRWQITNTGEEAEKADCLRGNKFEYSEIARNGIFCGKKEATAYSGKHYVQCFIIKNGNQCVAMSEPFVVRIR